MFGQSSGENARFAELRPSYLYDADDEFSAPSIRARSLPRQLYNSARHAGVLQVYSGWVYNTSWSLWSAVRALPTTPSMLHVAFPRC